MRKEQKSQVIEEIAAQLGEAQAIYAVDYRGLSVPQAAELRASLREQDATFRIVKNTLTLRAAEQAGVEQIKELVADGPTALTFVRGDAALAAKALDTFARRADVLQFKGGVMDGRPLAAADIQSLARLPARDVLNAQFAGVVASPLTGLVRGLGSLVSGLAVALAQVRDQKESQEPSHPEPEPAAEAAAPAAEEPAAEESAAERPAEDEPPAEAQPEAAAEAEPAEDAQPAEDTDAEKEAQ
jgi:large subunit ribosomal protein L10